jgi:twitching motility protein PilT
MNELLQEMVARDASDLHLRSGHPVLLRIYGDLVPMDSKAVPEEEVVRLVYSILTPEQIQAFERDLELDLAYELSGTSRYRVNVYKHKGSLGTAIRAIPYGIPTMEELNLPPICWFLADRPRGLILITGPAGSGKSTTQAAMLNYVNTKYPLHVMTVEDPIEFVHDDKAAMVNQREVGRDTLTFANALKWVLRQDPDVILVGEMRDLETMANAITAAETGHLVFGTLHTTNAVQTVDRVVDVFPKHQQQQIRIQLSVNLQGVVSQTLVKRKDGTGRVAAFETLLATPAVRNMIREASTHQIGSMIQTGLKQGMMTLDQSLANLVTKGVIEYQTGLEKASNVEEFHRLLEPSDAKAASRN